MAAVMDGIQSQSVPFVTIMDKGTLTSDHLDGAGTKMVKRSRETMESMIQEYARKTNEVKNPPKKKKIVKIYKIKDWTITWKKL